LGRGVLSIKKMVDNKEPELVRKGSLDGIQRGTFRDQLNWSEMPKEKRRISLRG